MFLSQKVSETLIRKKKECFLFFDISQAFDKVWHSGIIYKLSKTGVPLYILESVKNFLINRKFFIKLNNFESTCVEIATGVPLGAVFSPFLFSIFINDVSKQDKKNNSYSYKSKLSKFFPINHGNSMKKL